MEIAAGGIEAAYYRVGGRSFRHVDPLGRDTDPTKYLQTVGGMSDLDRRRQESERNWPWEKWYGVCEWRDASVKHQDAGAFTGSSTSSSSCATTAKRGSDTSRASPSSRKAPWRCRSSCGPVRPRVYAVRLVNPNRSEEPPIPALILEATPEEPTTLVLSPRAFVANRIMRCDEPGPVRKFKLTHIVQRGGDFERVAFEAVDPDF